MTVLFTHTRAPERIAPGAVSVNGGRLARLPGVPFAVCQSLPADCAKLWGKGA